MQAFTQKYLFLRFNSLKFWNIEAKKFCGVYASGILLGRIIFAAMGQKKLLRFSQIKSFTNVKEYPKDAAGTWHSFFGNANPLVLELACGRGEYTIGLARLFPNQNFLGVDVKGNRMYIGARQALDQQLTNAGFLRTQIEMIADYFAPGEVSEIWITFPDPQLRTSKAKKRLTHPRFLRLYQKILKPGGKIHLKTDSPDLYQFTRFILEKYQISIITDVDDVYGNGDPGPVLSIQTHYEKLDIAQSKRTFYLCFSLEHPLPASDEGLQDLLKQREQIAG